MSVNGNMKVLQFWRSEIAVNSPPWKWPRMIAISICMQVQRERSPCKTHPECDPGCIRRSPCSNCLFLNFRRGKRDQVWPRIVAVWSQFLSHPVASAPLSLSWHRWLFLFRPFLRFTTCGRMFFFCPEINLSTTATQRLTLQFPLKPQSS